MNSDCFALLNQYEHLNNVEIEGKEIIPKTTQPPEQQKSDHLAEKKQSCNEEQVRAQLTNKCMKLSPQ